MAPPVAPSSDKNPASQGMVDDDRVGDAPLIAKLTSFMRQYSPAHQVIPDTLDDRFIIDLTKPLPEFDSATAKAYAASDMMQPSKLCYAHICVHGTIQRHRAIALMKAMECRFIVQLLAAGPVTLSTSKDERFAIVYERPVGIKLSELMKKKRIPINQAFITEHILSPLAQAIHALSELELSHGCVNPDNIFISDIATLGPCVSEPCGYSQHFAYESVERAQALPAGKGEGSTAHDYYALAVTLLYVLYGPGHFEHYTKDELIKALLKQGPYHVLMQEKEAPESFYDFFRGTLTLGIEERWNSKQVLPWIGGKRYNVLPPPAPGDAVRPYEFSDVLVNTRRELANLFARDWEHMTAALNNNQLAHWVSVSLRNKELSDTISRLSKTAYDMSTRNDGQTSEALMNIVMLLDPAGPIRIRHISMHIDGIDTLCIELYQQKSSQDLQLLARFIEANMMNYWLELQQKLHKNEYKIPTIINNLNIRCDRLRGTIRNTSYGFGIERMLYDLNPEINCLSPMLDGAHVTTLTDLLIQLDKKAPSANDDEDPIDRHIAAFIANRLSIQHEIRLHDLASVPALANNRSVLALYLLALAQERADPVRLPGLSHWLVLRLLPLLVNIHGRTTRQKIKSLLMSYAPMGYLPKIAELLVTAHHVEQDAAAFQKARQLFAENVQSMDRYQKAENIEYDSVRMGYNIARMVAYICMLGSFFLVMRLDI